MRLAGLFLATLPLGDDVDGEAEMPGEDGLADSLAFANIGDLTRGKELDRREA